MSFLHSTLISLGNLTLDLSASASCIDKVAVFAPSPHLALLIRPTVLSVSLLLT